MNTIVVGVDGSEHGEAALAFAAEEAALRGAHLLIVCAWETPMVVAPMGYYPAEAFEGLAENAKSIAQSAVARVAELQPVVTCEGRAIEGQPAAVLLKEAEQADMIVVGSRGRGGFANLLLGSVTQQVVHHAPCPVVVVR
jgi:nucleotide-binding universal stress UspA family protein